MPTAKNPFQMVQSEKLSERISHQLLQTIASGHYLPGDMLPPERDLATAFHVSRVAVREALGSLGAKGILSVRQGRGTTVNPMELWNTLDPEVLMLLQGDQVFDKLIEMRRIFEPELAAIAATNISPEEIEELRGICDLPETDSMEQHVERDTAFHVLIARATHNPVLLIVFSSISDLLRESRRRTFSVSGELAKARQWHHAIFTAIEKHDAEAARQAMTAHLGQVGEALHHYSPQS
jgi:GntR family transcriptional regulator, transcriptional repressor for pyruvate dehydrogenase complex